MNDDLEKIPRMREESLCPCKSRETYAKCCMRFHYGRAQPETAEQLMRSRYAAFFFRRVQYLVETTHPDTRSATLQTELEQVVNDMNWNGLTVLSSSKGTADDKTGKVEFIATYYQDFEPHEIHERSRFRRHKGLWKYYDNRA